MSSYRSAATRTGLWVCLLAAGLAGCASQPPAPPPPRVSPPPVAPPPPPKVEAPPPKPVRPPVAAPKPAVEPIQLLGLSKDQLVQRLGQPAERLPTDPGQSWIYQAPPCRITLLMFLDLARNDYVVLDRQVTGTDGSEVAAQRCLQRIAHDAHR